MSSRKLADAAPKRSHFGWSPAESAVNPMGFLKVHRNEGFPWSLGYPDFKFFSRMRSEGFSFYIWDIWGSGGGNVFAWPCFWCPQLSTTVRARPSWQKSWRVYGGSHKNVSFSTCQKMWPCRFAQQAWHFVTFDVCEEECLCAAVVRVKLPCLGGEATKTCLSPRVRRCGHVVLRGRCGTICHSRLTPHCTCHTLNWHSTLHTLHSTLYTPHFTLHTSHCILYIPHFTLLTLHSTHDTLHSTLYTPHSTRLHPTLYTPHFTLQTWHSTLHSTLHTLHFTLRTPHLYTLHTTLYTPHSTLYTLHSTPLHSTLYTSHSTLRTLRSTLHTPHFTLHTLHSTHHTLHSTLHTLHSTPLHSTLYTSHSTLRTLRSTLYTPHFTLHNPHSPLSILHSTLHTLHSTFHTFHSTLHIYIWFW